MILLRTKEPWLGITDLNLETGFLNGSQKHLFSFGQFCMLEPNAQQQQQQQQLVFQRKFAEPKKIARVSIFLRSFQR